ncbi:hypothetical protein AG4045_007167 [Apium graveolens]|uniref:Uncharacterized protein n=1 Tax=Apium graveolens TaxID=4045 RepID=A0A6L5BC08_APIGR|nr:hypothetical protein AG4045_007167 [Apium graveolens]
MEEYSKLWSAGHSISEEYNYGYDQYEIAGFPIFEEYNCGFYQPCDGLHGLADTEELEYVFENKVNSSHDLGGSNDVVSFMNPTNYTTLGEVSTDDYDIIGSNDNVGFVYETKPPYELYNNHHANATYGVDQGPEDDSFLDGIEDELAQLVSNVVNSNYNSTLEKPGPLSPMKNRMAPHPQHQ